MTFEERQRFKELQETVKALRERLEDEDAELGREDALSLLDILEYVFVSISPERRDHMMETIAGEAARRAEGLTRRY